MHIKVHRSILYQEELNHGMTFQIGDTNLLLVLGLSCSLCTLMKFSREDLLF